MLHAIGVARIQVDFAAVGGLDVGMIAKAVAGIDPAVDPAIERIRHAMRIVAAEGAIQLLPLFGVAVVVGIGVAGDLVDAIDHHRAGNWGHAQRDIKAIDERGHLVGMAVPVAVDEDLERVARFDVGLGGPGIFNRVGEQHPAAIVEAKVHRLVNRRLAGKELDLEARREMKFFDFLFGREGLAGSNVVGPGGRGQHGQTRRSEAEPQTQNKAQSQRHEKSREKGGPLGGAKDGNRRMDDINYITLRWAGSQATRTHAWRSAAYQLRRHNSNGGYTIRRQR